MAKAYIVLTAVLLGTVIILATLMQLNLRPSIIDNSGSSKSDNGKLLLTIYRDGGEFYATTAVGTPPIYSSTDPDVLLDDCLSLAAQKGGADILFASGTYTLSTSHLLTSNLTIRGFENAVIKYSNSRDPLFYSDESGYSRKTTPIVLDVAKQSRSLRVKDTSDFHPGDYVKLFDDSTIGGALKGEILKIKAISRNTMQLEQNTTFSYIVNLSASVRSLEFIDHLQIEGLTFVGPGTETPTYLLEGYLLKDLTVRNCSVSDWGTAAFYLCDSLNIVFEGNHFSRVFRTGFGYSIEIDNGCNQVVIESNRFDGGGRHYIATGTTTGSWRSGGVFQNLLITNNIFADSLDEAINNHDGSYGPMTIENNSFVGCSKGVELANTYTMIRGNEFVKCGVSIDLIENVENNTVFIIGNKFEDSTGYGIKNAIKNVRVVDNIFINSEFNLLVKFKEFRNNTIINNP